MQRQTTERQLQALIEQKAADAPGVLLAVHAPLHGLDWAGAAGRHSLEGSEKLSVNTGFRIASMSKTFTGVLVAQLLERGALALTDPISDYLPPDIAALVPVADGHVVSDITIEHLLRHRAGFNDFALSQEWLTEIAADPGRARTPEEIIRWACAHTSLVGAPGEKYTYTRYRLRAAGDSAGEHHRNTLLAVVP